MDSDGRWKAILELRSVLTEFWHDVDTNWGRNAGDFYAEDGVFEASGATYRGRAKVEEFYRYRLNRGDRVAVHAVTNFRASFQTPLSAVSTWYLFLYANDGKPVLPSAPPIQIALATDHSVKGDDGRWRIKNRKFDTWFKGGVPTTSPNLG